MSLCDEAAVRTFAAKDARIAELVAEIEVTGAPTPLATPTSDATSSSSRSEIASGGRSTPGFPEPVRDPLISRQFFAKGGLDPGVTSLGRTCW